MKIGRLTIEWKSKKKEILDELKVSKIKAVKKARELHGWGLKQAVDYVKSIDKEW